MLHGLMQFACDTIIKDATIVVSHDPYGDVSFSDYDYSIDGILSSKNADEEVRTEKLWSLGIIRIWLLKL